MGKLLKWLFFGFIGLAGLGSIIDSSKSPEQKAAEQQERQRQESVRAEAAREQASRELASLPTASAADLAAAYSSNTVGADLRFKGKKFKVTGTVSDINTDFLGNPYLILRGGVNQFSEPQFQFSKSEAARLGTLKKGNRVVLVCTGKGDVAKTPMSGDCILL
jgi:Mrp family chromosome partitioning ATPase